MKELCCKDLGRYLIRCDSQFSTVPCDKLVTGLAVTELHDGEEDTRHIVLTKVTYDHQAENNESQDADRNVRWRRMQVGRTSSMGASPPLR